VGGNRLPFGKFLLFNEITRLVFVWLRLHSL
jgi:hypothetical protein